ncbi:MAG: Asp-tRNA(Asn)/Glu-tRNA(Gln) amidotransferase subunit GatA [Elusimicrobia bacterium]|nr:Asp-tRNA(Asn)/Glu-tRNA(Gln) amidotransferase subunit GatA [Elusimicrobiota bacterium]MBD3412392.1 Asp-tRNA(Asn)/Glu-tRNA(Gln) amidotransferase subunit GatA [Elusimicrobiota bacterium]
MDITMLSCAEIAQRVRTKKLRASDVVESCLREIAKNNPSIKAFISVFEKEAQAQAQHIDARVRDGNDPGLLAGVPLALKDNICVKNLPTTCASAMLKEYRPPYDAYCVERVRNAGAVIIGKTNLDEFAMGSSTENSAFFTTRNPWNTACIPGGSSGGSAAAVAAGMVPAAIGSDTGGSIRQPAGLCGVVGMKPTYGRVSRYGLVAFGSSLDQIGPITRTAADAALLLRVLAGHDHRDATSLTGPVPDYTKMLSDDLNGIRIGIPSEYFIDGLHSEVEAAVRNAIAVCEQQGATVTEISLPHTGYAVAVYYIIAPSEASANLARYDGVKYGFRSPEGKTLLETYERTRSQGFGQEVQRRIMLGTYALSAGYYDAYYEKAQKVRRLIQQDFMEAFSRVDAIITPTSPTSAFPIGDKIDDPLSMYLSDIFTISCNLAGIPGIAVPCGFTQEGLPVSMQILGPLQKDELVLRTAHAFQLKTDYHTRRPLP